MKSEQPWCACLHVRSSSTVLYLWRSATKNSSLPTRHVVLKQLCMYRIYATKCARGNGVMESAPHTQAKQVRATTATGSLALQLREKLEGRRVSPTLRRRRWVRDKGKEQGRIAEGLPCYFGRFRAKGMRSEVLRSDEHAKLGACKAKPPSREIVASHDWEYL